MLEQWQSFGHCGEVLGVGMKEAGSGRKRASLERFPVQTRANFVSEELGTILASLVEACPPRAKVSFYFDGKLHVHIDVRAVEDVTRVEALLPTIGAGMFHTIKRGSTPGHAFFHRVSALVER